jgi:hypothetical protein
MEGTSARQDRGRFHFCPERIDPSAEQVGFELSIHGREARTRQNELSQQLCF